jgi:hypothetical protein
MGRPLATNTPTLGDDTTTIFSAPQSMSSAEREAVKKGEDRGKKVAMQERPEHYGCIGNEDTIKMGKGYNFAFGRCKRCEQFNSKHNDVVGAHCRLPEKIRCIR